LRSSWEAWTAVGVNVDDIKAFRHTEADTPVNAICFLERFIRLEIAKAFDCLITIVGHVECNDPNALIAVNERSARC
jgi:hypothetical protein